MQHTNRAFWRRRARFIARTHHQRTQIKIMTIPGFIDRNRQIQPLSRNINLLPPQRPFTGLDHRITFTRRWRGNMQLNGIARAITGFIQFQRDTVGSHCTTPVAVVLPAIASPETHTTDRFIRRFDFQTISAPLNRETDLTGFIRLKIQSLFIFNQIFLIKL